MCKTAQARRRTMAKHQIGPYKAPWPRGVDTRVIDDPKLGKLCQLRDGAMTPPTPCRVRVAGEPIAYFWHAFGPLFCVN